MSYQAIATKIEHSLKAFETAQTHFVTGSESVDETLRLFTERTDVRAREASEFVAALKETEGHLETLKQLIPQIVAGLDDLRPHYTADEEPETAHVYEERSGWRRLIPGLKTKKTTVITRTVPEIQRTVSLQKAFIEAKEWNDRLMTAVVELADRFDTIDERLQDRLVEIKERALNFDKSFAETPDEAEQRHLLALRLYMEEIARFVQEHLVSISLYKREFSALAASVRKSMEAMPEEDDFFNVKSDEDVERFIKDSRSTSMLAG